MIEAFERHLLNNKAQKEFIEGSEQQRIAFCEEYLNKVKPKKEPKKEEIELPATDYFDWIIQSTTQRETYSKPKIEYLTCAFEISDFECRALERDEVNKLVDVKRQHAFQSMLDKIIRDKLFEMEVSHQHSGLSTLYTLKIGVVKP